ncbi:hypothetical protein [Deinococcus aestuarii]|uniref:hypothetical protein n=1 Tax=Deinococcus aestuarii TaxID=2774531 RepID=UPI001C0B20FB|nr:hypothetical protein [Deinococcus aestuarii]
MPLPRRGERTRSLGTLPPLLTLAQLREPGTLGQDLVTAARRHVGAAGLEQTASLERLLRVCREQAAVGTALRSLAWALGRMGDGGDGEAGARATLLAALNTQLELAARIEAVLADALRDVTSTPAVFISAAALQEIEQDAKGQLQTLKSLFHEARRYGRTPEQQQEFERLGQGMQEALDRAEQDEAAGRAETLGVIIAEATAQLVKLPGMPTPALTETLERIAAELRAKAAR